MKVLTLKAELIDDSQQSISVHHSAMQPLQTSYPSPKIIPSKSLNAYIHSWTIKVRIILKHDLRSLMNSKGVGKVFSFDVIDKGNSEIPITCFNM
jgi:hypothetical protein